MIQQLSLAKKLWICGIALSLPVVTLSIITIAAKNEPINFAKFEKLGNQYQRPVMSLMVLLAQHKMAAQRGYSGDEKSWIQLDELQTKMDNAMLELSRVDAEVGATLQFTQEGLAKRKREHVQLSTISAEWQALKNQVKGLKVETSNDQHNHLIADFRTMITHSGDTSNLILDPDLDSYYLMDVTLLVAPQLIDRMQEIITYVGPLLSKEALSNEEKIRIAVYSALLKKSDLERIEGDVLTALNEDSHFYDLSPSLHNNVPSAIAALSTSLNNFIQNLDKLSSGEMVSPTVFRESGEKTWDSSLQIFKTCIDELDVLLAKRIDVYNVSKRNGIFLAVGGLLLFIGLSTYIVLGLTRMLNLQITTIGQAALEVQGNSRNISTISTKLNDSTTEQAAAIEETSSSMTEMSAMLSQTGKNSMLTLTEAEDGQKETNKGKVVISKMMSAMDEIHSANDRLVSLVKLIAEIESKTRVINNIVFETRLLSFNASIEAARAGVHGKGFAVVAEEVGKLAAMSGKAAEDIRNLLDSGTKEVSEVVNSTQERVVAGKSVSQECATAFDSMSKTLERITDSVRMIAAATKEQEIGVKQTNKAMSEMDKVTHRNSGDAATLANHAKSLTGGAHSLLGAIHTLRGAIHGEKSEKTMNMAHSQKQDSNNLFAKSSNNVVEMSSYRQDFSQEQNQQFDMGGDGNSQEDPSLPLATDSNEATNPSNVDRSDSRWKSA